MWCVQSFSCLSRAPHASFTAWSSCCLNYSMDATTRAMKRKQHPANFPPLCSENQRGVLGWCFSTSSGVRSPAPSIQPLPLGAELSSPLPYPNTLLLPLLGLQGQRDSCLLPSPLLSALFLFFFFSCAVALTEYGNMFMNLLHQSQPCDKAVSL